MQAKTMIWQNWHNHLPTAPQYTQKNKILAPPSIRDHNDVCHEQMMQDSLIFCYIMLSYINQCKSTWYCMFVYTRPTSIHTGTLVTSCPTIIIVQFAVCSSFALDTSSLPKISMNDIAKISVNDHQRY